MSIMTKIILLGFALVLLANSVAAHGWMSSPLPRGQYRSPKRMPYEEIAPATTDPTDANFVCRSDPEMPKANWLPLRAGQSQSITLEITAKHVGDCFVYLTYDGDKSMSEMKWFKIWAQHECKNADKYDIPIPSYLPSGDHVIFRWEWYALHVFPTIEYYAQCVDATMTGTAGGVLPQPQVSMPGHLPKSTGSEYWDPWNNKAMFFTGPAIATVDGQTSTSAPVTSAPATVAPATSAPVTAAPATSKPTNAPTAAGTTKPTNAPATAAPVTAAPATSKPTNAPPVAGTTRPTNAPATAAPVTAAPATSKPTNAPTAAGTTKPTNAPYTPCQVSNYVKLEVLPDTSNWWFATRITGHRSYEVVKMEIKDSGAYTTLVEAKIEWADVWVFSPSAAFTYPLTVKASLASGSSLSFTVNRLPAAGSIDSGSVFP